MEVLTGNQSEPSQARRRGDRNANDQRALHWQVRDGDIVLFPHSPLALADVLSTTQGCFDLVAQSGSTPAGVSNENADSNDHKDNSANATASLQQRRARKNPRERANLLTQLTPDALRECCKRIQVENALVKRIGIKQLYLTAGFLCWKDEATGTVSQRAPVLFYPATLIRRDREGSEDTQSASANMAIDNDAGDDQYSYEIRIDNTAPETNTILLAWCREHAEFTVPEFTPDQALQDYFAQLAQTIAEFKHIELEFDIALGNAAPPHDISAPSDPVFQLPALPEHFDTSLAMAITGNKNLAQLHSVLNLIQGYRASVSSPESLNSAANEAAGAISNLHEYAKKLAGAGLENVEFQHLPQLPENISTWIANVEKALTSALITDVLATPTLSARHLIRLAGAIELIDKAPLSLEQYKHADLCYSATPGLLQRARHQARLIEDELSTLQTIFLLDKVPAKKQLLSLINELGGNLEEEPDIIDADYFNARRQFMEFSIEKPTNLTPEHRNKLGKLAKVLRFRELFVNNIEYRLALGPGYRGLRTDWDALTEAVDYAQEISEVLESEALAAKAMGNWNVFRGGYVSDFDVLQTAAESLRKLLWICGREWQSSSVADVLEHASHTRTKLIAWADIYGDISADKTNTSANVLAQFSGKSREDVITEIHVGETHATINEHISGGGTSAAAVVETIEWLRQASKTASEHQLEITAIVEHLHIA